MNIFHLNNRNRQKQKNFNATTSYSAKLISSRLTSLPAHSFHTFSLSRSTSSPAHFTIVSPGLPESSRTLAVSNCSKTSALIVFPS